MASAEAGNGDIPDTGTVRTADTFLMTNPLINQLVKVGTQPALIRVEAPDCVLHASPLAEGD